MVILAYNLSSNLQSYMKKTETIRKKLALTPLSPKIELRLKWEAALERTYWSLVMTENSLSKKQMVKILSKSKKKLEKEEKEVVNYKKAFDYIKQEWTASNKPVTLKTLQKIYDISCKPTTGQSGSSFNAAKKDLEHFLSYLERSDEHPVIQAGIAQIQLIGLAPFSDGNGRVARLAPYLFLYKHGYDFRDLLVIDEYFRKDLQALKQAVETVERNKNLTLWLEYFAFGVLSQARRALRRAEGPKFKTQQSASYWELNDRQKEILNLLDQPGTKITNKKVQKEFKVSQITASRDLSKLVDLGLLFQHGKGRSTYYTKV